MATMTFQIAAGQTYTATKTISAQDLTRLLNVQRTIMCQPAAIDSDAAAALADMLFQYIKSTVLNVEQYTAQKAVVPPVVITLT